MIKKTLLIKSIFFTLLLLFLNPYSGEAMGKKLQTDTKKENNIHQIQSGLGQLGPKTALEDGQA
jgi:hypothetical protein